MKISIDHVSRLTEMYLDTQLETKFEVYLRYRFRYTKCI